MKKIIIMITTLLSINCYALPITSCKDNPLEKYLCGALTGNFAFTTNSLFRGVSQSNNNPSVQGTLIYTLQKSGIYFNLFGASTDQTDVQGNRATVEFDTTVGIANKLSENFRYDVSMTRYNYPRASGLNYIESNGIVFYRFLVGKIGYSMNVYNTHRTGIYYEGGVSIDVPPRYALSLSDVNFQASVGRYRLPRVAGLSTYNNYYLLVSKAIANYLLVLQWTGTNVSSGQGSLAGHHIVGTVLVSF